MPVHEGTGEYSTSQLGRNDLFNLSGMVSVVTGGGTGIGLMIAQGLSANGAKVYIVGRRQEVLEKAVKEHEGVGQMIALVGDTTDKESIQSLVKDLSEKESYIDLLVNNAGVAGDMLDENMDTKNFGSVYDALWNQTFETTSQILTTNVLGYYYTAVGFLPLLHKSTSANTGYSAQILNVTSNASFGKMPMNNCIYSASKAASTHLSKMLATLLADSKIRSNVLAPGLYPSEMTAGDSNENNQSNLGKDQFGMEIPAGRAGTTPEMAATAVFMASKANTYMNGSVVMTDGGVLLKMPSVF
ncbi:protein of unknown function [Taphrina deformans PYCC 5710]|uniref:Short chain dehydrogenase/reductase family n=1 Tax=Taphrina deformans (strain PYCC 5710 / ATCC 11124 / CBS 356.35 / IMI 108563 / JCM 9778 / NBRC 8474) TaxID=1097556 RepID=R4XF04_TAPDE|nr:protein of unknown function [Taphrina deformans PYCC 5710]|eukprot:CCG84447.1 protein of unknown function [Taphrina deformans PYCC 5710]